MQKYDKYILLSLSTYILIDPHEAHCLDLDLLTDGDPDDSVLMTRLA